MNTAVTASRGRMNVVAVVLCCLAGTLATASNVLLGAPGIAMGAEKADAPTKEPEPGDPEKAPAQSESSKDDGVPGDEPGQSDAAESEEIFVPTEDISEDIDVPFPVDI